METNNLNIRYFVDDPEASEQEMLLKLFHFEGNESNTLNIEHGACPNEIGLHRPMPQG